MDAEAVEYLELRGLLLRREDAPHVVSLHLHRAL